MRTSPSHRVCLTSLALLALMGTPARAMQDEPRGCATIAGITTQVGQCADAPHGVVLAATADRAAALAALAAEGEVRFARHFDRTPPPYAVIEGDGTLDPAIGDALAAAGYVWRMPWLSPAFFAERINGSLRRVVETRAQAQGLAPDAAERMVAAALAQNASRFSPEAVVQRERGVVPHELGHGWLMRGWWPDAPPQPEGAPRRYGGPGPDWMDELAAVLMEDEATARNRRDDFDRRLTTGSATRDRLLDLKTYLTMAHPALAAIATSSSPEAKRTASIMVLGAEESRFAADQGILFYLQSRLFADYLIERAGPSRAFVTAADTFAAGGTTADWLARHGASLGIATDIDTLQSDWQAWVAARGASKSDA